MKDAEISKNLKDFQDIEPDEKWYHVNRTILLNIIEKDSVSSKSKISAKKMFFGIFVFTRNIMPNWKMALSSFVAVALIGGTVFGAGASLPGDSLYPVKIGMENVQLALVSDNSVQSANIRLQHIDNRLEELQKLSETNKSQEHLASLTKNIEENMVGVQTSLKAIEKNPNVKQDQLISLVTLVDKKTLDTSLTLKKVNKDDKTINSIVQLANQAGQTALGIMMTKGDIQEQETIKKSLDTKISLQETSLSEVTKKIEDAKTAIASSTKQNTNTSTDQQTEFSINQIQKLDPAQITKYLTEAKDLLAKNDYKGALLKVEEAQFYLDMSDKALDFDGYKKDIENMEQNIKDAETNSQK